MGFVQIVEFDSYESAMRNSESQLTQDFTATLAPLCDGPPNFRNLDVRDVHINE